jgi:ubiquinone/menaquinone biosynthesis C-methylase UbiE
LSQDDPEVVRREYADETGLAGRFALWQRQGAPRPAEIGFAEIVAAAPRRILEVGCGRGELAERLVEGGYEVVALDQSERMVELTRARGVDARVGDAQELPFPDGSFDVAVANHMLYHVPDVERALAELARVLRAGGTLVAATNGFRQLGELWDLVGRDLSDRSALFMRETGEPMLRRHFATVRLVPFDGTLELTADEMRDYIRHSVRHKHLAELLPDLPGTVPVTVSGAVFVAQTEQTAM